MEKSGKRILVLDDDPDIGVMLKMMLEFKGYTAIVTERAESARKVIYSEPVDLIILDMLLSGVNGTEICVALKKDIVTAPIPIIMISAHPNAKELCEEAGADSFISKPFDMHDMLATIDNLLEVESKKI